jgi:AcrR family transcriptional regulator
MRDLATASGTSLANLYHYVGGKEDLLYQVERRLLDAAVASAQATLVVPGARERLRAILADHVRRVLARPFEARVLRGEGGPLRPERARRVEEQRRRYHALVRAVAEAALRGRGWEGDADTWTHLLLGMADRLALEAGRSARASTADRLAGRILAVAFGAKRPRTRRT